MQKDNIIQKLYVRTNWIFTFQALMDFLDGLKKLELVMTYQIESKVILHSVLRLDSQIAEHNHQ